MNERATTVETYLAELPEARRAIAMNIRGIVRDIEPDARESLRYGMPAFGLANGVVLHLGFWKHHLGLYPIYPGSATFEAAIKPFRFGKDGVRFSLSEPVPMELVRTIVLEMSQRPGG